MPEAKKQSEGDAKVQKEREAKSQGSNEANGVEEEKQEPAEKADIKKADVDLIVGPRAASVTLR